MTPLAGKLIRRIEDEGPVSVENYMAVCLGDPGYGYYRRAAAPIGKDGDFITAPEISQTFGELIGLWAGAVWHAMGSPSPVRLVEFGPGRGTLMADALRAARAVPGFMAACDIHLVEISPALRALQRNKLGSHAPAWHETPETIPPGPAIIIANEFFDALPVRQMVFRDGTWFERCVTWEGDEFRFIEGAAGLAPPPFNAREPHNGDIHESRPAADELLSRLGRWAGDEPFAMLVIDYGHRGGGLGDTLQAVARHTFANPLVEPGDHDLSAHVDFGALGNAATAAGLVSHGPVPLGLFLLRLGIGERLAALCRSAPGQTEMLTAGVRRLTSPHDMGELFQVIAVTSSPLKPLPF